MIQANTEMKCQGLAQGDPPTVRNETQFAGRFLASDRTARLRPGRYLDLRQISFTISLVNPKGTLCRLGGERAL